MIDFKPSGLLLALVILVLFANRVHAFGAGNIASISKIEGVNWRHGDIEDALLALKMAQVLSGKKFNDLQVSRVYFGNWLRDYSQAIDVGTVKNVSAEAIRLCLSILGFLTFGYGSGEFEVTAERLGCYRPEEHIDNPKGYGEGVDARDYHRALRGPIDEATELAVEEETGMLNYIANERVGIQTSSQLVRDLLTRSIELARSYGRNNNKTDKYESLRLLGTALHCLEDFFAHSNFLELTLIEMGEREIFPHVGSQTKCNIHEADYPVYPIVTGTFGGVDFLHSVTGEVSDKLTQNELEELENQLSSSSSKANTSYLRELLDKIPAGIFGGSKKSDRLEQIEHDNAASQLQNMHVSPREPEEFTRYVQDVFKQIMPVIEFHDDVLKSISKAIGSIPVLPKVLDQLEEQLSLWVFSQIAPLVMPVVNQIRSEMSTGSDQIIQSSENEQHVVFNDDHSTNPTHSMLSKDHFTNMLNTIAGRAASAVVTWVVPQIMDLMDNDHDPRERVDEIIQGVLHHPAQRRGGRGAAHEGRRIIFECVENWWNELGQDGQDEYRSKLSREGVQRGENHRGDVKDTGHGHGCMGSLQMHKSYRNDGGPATLEDKIATAAAGAIISGVSGAFKDAMGGDRREEGRSNESRYESNENRYGNNNNNRYDNEGRYGSNNDRNESNVRHDSEGYGGNRYDPGGHSGGNQYGENRYESNNRNDSEGYGGRHNENRYESDNRNDSDRYGRQHNENRYESDNRHDSNRYDNEGRYGGNDNRYENRQENRYENDGRYGGNENRYEDRQEHRYENRHDENRHDENRHDDNNRYNNNEGHYNSSHNENRYDNHDDRRDDHRNDDRREDHEEEGSGTRQFIKSFIGNVLNRDSGDR